MILDDYRDRFSYADIQRDDDRVLTVRLHTDGGPMVWAEEVHQTFADLLHAIGSDRQTRVVILTGTGAEFLHYPAANTEYFKTGALPVHGWDRQFFDARRIMDNLINIEVPVIAAMNGPAAAHSEIALLSDIVIASDDVSFADVAHFPTLVPGDGIHLVWSMLLGANRARYHLLTGKRISAAEALEWGLVGELLPRDDVLPRARAVAAELARANPLVLRYTRQTFTQPFKRAFTDQLALGMTLEAIAGASIRAWTDVQR